jgi:hypothetical protein|tara:strand:- start:27 stop:176 length:150 start_codon:yes stop_codon:yes gene_type:complete
MIYVSYTSDIRSKPFSFLSGLDSPTFAEELLFACLTFELNEGLDLDGVK